MVIEHNLDVIKCADWIIDLGPESGDEGGSVVFEGTPEALVASKKGITSKYLKEKLQFLEAETTKTQSFCTKTTEYYADRLTQCPLCKPP